jgi:hypothetical protein
LEAWVLSFYRSARWLWGCEEVDHGGDDWDGEGAKRISFLVSRRFWGA